MGERRVLDFDRARAERREIVLKAFGEEITVPGSPPLTFVMLANKLKEKGDDYEPGFEEMTDLVEAMIGEKAFTHMMANAPEQEDLEWIVEAITDEWAEDDEEGEAKAPEPGAGSDTSETTGTSSKPTSPESTATTSAPPSEILTTPFADSQPA